MGHIGHRQYTLVSRYKEEEMKRPDMLDAILIGSILAFFVFGWFLGRDKMPIHIDYTISAQTYYGLFAVLCWLTFLRAYPQISAFVKSMFS